MIFSDQFIEVLKEIKEAIPNIYGLSESNERVLEQLFRQLESWQLD